MRNLLLLLTASLALALGLGLPALDAAPSTLLETEIQLPLESADGFALIDQATGQVRIITVGISNTATAAAPVNTGLPNVTGATSGLNDGGAEALVLASATANRLAFFNTATGSSSPRFPDELGPNHPTYVRKAGGGAPQDLHIANTFNPGGDILSHYRDPAGAFTQQDQIGNFNAVPSYQPYYSSPAGVRYAAGVANSGASTRLFYTFVNGSDAIGGFLQDFVPVDTLLTTNVRRNDNTLMLVGYKPGEKDLSIVPISAPPALDPVTTFSLPYPVANVAPAGGGSDGILVTALGGASAAHYRITPANTLTLIQTFNPPTSTPIHGLVTVPGRGIMILSGKAGFPSGHFQFRVWDGGAWGVKDQGGLPKLIGPTPNFATLFWFSSEPLVDPFAELLELVVNPDWTSKSDPNPIPAQILTETYTGPSAGLDNPVSTIPSPPAGANFLVTNQFLDSISLSALDDTLVLTIPALGITPPSGGYTNPIDATAIYDEDTTEVFYRLDEFGAAWQPYTNVIPIAYTSTYQFYARNLGNGTPGPIISRTYSFPTADLTSFDADADGVPDFVEIANNLNPNGGADTDADGYTDLDELLNVSLPNANGNIPAPGTADYPFVGAGFRILAQAHDANSAEASNGDPAAPTILTDGEPIDLHGMTSSLLGSAPVETLTSPPSLAGQLAANLSIGSAVPVNHWLTLSSPKFFTLDGAAPEVRGGREIYKIIQRPVQLPPTIAPVLSGTDLAADAAAWLAAAATAYASYEQVSAITALDPIDTALAVICEAALFDALTDLSPAEQTALGVPQDIPADPGPPAFPAIPGYQQFTLFGNRDGDSARTALSPAMRDALVIDGLAFPELLSALDTAVTSSSPSLNTLTDALYNFHVAHSKPTAAALDVIPLLPLPLDVLRGLARGGDLPTDYLGVVTPATVNVAKTEMANALALRSGAYRPTATWTVEVAAPVVPGDHYSYTNLASTNPVVFYEPDGDRMQLDQGLGLALTTRFSVTGYTDVTGPAGHDAMELISLNVVFVPAASDNDGDGNLLDDEWEEFFFGATGMVSPFDTHPVNGYSYLQLFLIGHDPRADCTEIPSEAMINLAPDNIQLIRLPNGNLAISFTFPTDHIGLFNFSASQTETLAGFTPFVTSILTSPSTDLYHLDLGPAASLPDRNFFHLLMSLQE